jgi:N6-L-threonylcarbamoyladenine synthase
MKSGPIVILGIETSCDDTAAAVVSDGTILSNIVSNQQVHKAYGGVVPELASRAHQQNIVPVVDQALKQANISKNDIAGIAFTRGPGLLGSLLVGSSFAKSLALSLSVPLIEVNHMQGHILAHFIRERDGSHRPPSFPFLCLTVSGGHTQIIRVDDYFRMTILGETRDDAAGEAFDKVAKIMGFEYPGGPLVDKFARDGNPDAFKFPEPEMPGFDFSFSGLKTAFLYFVQERQKQNPSFAEENRSDICASIQKVIVNMLLNKLIKASKELGIREIAVAGGVSANSGLRAALKSAETTRGWRVYIPKFEYCTDNAAMIAITGYYKYLRNEFTEQSISATPRLHY